MIVEINWLLIIIITITQRDERERIQLQKITDNTVAIRASIDNGGGVSSPGSSSGAVLSPADSNEVLKQITRTRKKIETMEETLQNRMSVVANEVYTRTFNKCLFSTPLTYKTFII